MNPQEFYEKMIDIRNQYDTDEEIAHEEMDDLMCKVLTELGYGDGVLVFEDTHKLYA